MLQWVLLPWLVRFLKIWLDFLGSLSERITSTIKCIRYKRYTRHKDFHRGNHKGENLANFFRIVRWSKTIIRNVQQLSFSPPLTVSLSHASRRVCEVCINEGEFLPIYTFSSYWPNIRLEPTCHFTWGPLFLEIPQLHITWCYLGIISLTYNRGCTSRSRHSLDVL